MRFSLVGVLIGYALFVGWFVGALEQVGEQIHRTYEQQNASLPSTFVQIDNIPGGLIVWSWRSLEPGRLWSLVSSRRPIDTTYVPQLTTLDAPHGNWLQDNRLAPDANAALIKLSRAATEAGHPIVVTSAYRSADEQQSLRRDTSALKGEIYARHYVAEPGHSEHQLGLAVDLSDYTASCVEQFSACSLSLATSQWLAINGPAYGFILRYPPDKTAVTGVNYEPWHFRYVGRQLANYIKKSGLTLDEIIPKLEAQRNT